jgi:hypothetical protein
VLSGAALIQVLGKDKAVELMAWADQRAQKAGFPGISWIATEHGGDEYQRGDPKLYRKMHIEATTLYTVIGLAGDFYQATPAGPLVDQVPAVWRRFPMRVELPIFCGWGSLMWSGRGDSIVTGFTPTLFEKHLRDAKRYLDQTGTKDIMIDCWNEWGEGEILGPHAQHGFRLLQAIPRVFAPDEPPRPVVVPQDVGLPVPQTTGLWKYVYRPVIEQD